MGNWFKKEDPRVRVFNNQLSEFRALDRNDRYGNYAFEAFPCLNDATQQTSFDAHYVYHPAWAIRIVKQINPAVHVDISSTLHFCSMLSAFVKTDFYDFRPAPLNLNGLTCLQADLTRLNFECESIASISCMHTIEHIGLGRYGDPIDPDGDLKALAELKRVCAIGGNLLIVVPVGKRKLAFNAHRIYHPQDIPDQLSNFSLSNFSLIDDKGQYIEHASFTDAAGQQYGCGCYWFIKRE